ncbi:TIGR03084 family protein [Amycolatopsis sp. K13G38]|uniref:TIGR03084 family protein n=1 Tax=Amycolatopsis acididurans TaxID=2724524 RepID=A0ABX1J6N2_9PSEU|nr:TIGR03084 family metal-binding protein [Amycolatopsis acididurans]NKQ55452.1 TIGR03084 family protein [Amycolatopsis acididurans]
MAGSMHAVLDDLVAETEVVQNLVAGLDDAGISAPTPAQGWSIRDQLTHLAYFDETATQAAVDPEVFRRDSTALMAAGMDFPDRVAAEYSALPAHEVRAWLARARAEFVAVFRELEPKTRLPWYGPDMSALSSVTARLMETWAHGQDIADALGRDREPTDRLRHIAHLGVRTTGFSFVLNGKPAPTAPIRVELDAPSGARWEWGPADAADRVTGPALDFCLAVTQRRHADDTALAITGPVAAEWISLAQTFAGAPGTGRVPGFATRQGATR